MFPCRRKRRPEAGPHAGRRQGDGYLEDYVTRKTLDGLFVMIAREEKSIRTNPAVAAGSPARKVFGVLQRAAEQVSAARRARCRAALATGIRGRIRQLAALAISAADVPPKANEFDIIA